MFQYAVRDKNINIAHSLGSVRFDPREPTRAEIMKRAQTEDFNPNLVSTRDEAVGATTLMFEGVPTYPTASRFWDVYEKHKVNIFYTARKSIRALMGCRRRAREQGRSLADPEVVDELIVNRTS